MGVTEECAEIWAARPEFPCGHHRYIDLQTTRKQEHAVDPGANAQVEMVEHAEFLVDHLHPILKDWLKLATFLDPESYVNVGPFVSRTKRHRAGDCACYDP